MTWAEIKTLVAANLGRTSSDISPLVHLWAQLFQKSVQRDRRYYFLRAKADRSIDETAQTYELPPGFKEHLQAYLVKTAPVGFKELLPVSDVEIIRMFNPGSAVQDRGEPTHYQLGAQSITFWPWPVAQATVRCEYWKDMDAPTSSSLDSFTNFWTDMYPDLYVANLTTIGFARLQMYKDAGAWQQEAARILSDVRADHVSRELHGDLRLAARQDVFGTSWAERSDSNMRIWR